ncbi:MAG: 50S ribosomal protein L24 [Chloroflexi bacterium]|nr:50S ribosomal protein L24 [Chloroflexota bacterium]
MRIRTGDTVLVIAGKEKGKTGRVERQFPEQDRVVVEGVNLVTRHMKGQPGVRQSGRIQKEGPIHASNVVLICNKCNAPTKPKTSFLDTGARVRKCIKCQEVIDDAR